MATDILTPEEFATRMKIGRSTLFEWLRKGVLVPGVHYFKQGRIIRFLWSDAVVASIVEATRQPATTDNPVVHHTPRTSKPGLNWEY